MSDMTELDMTCDRFTDQLSDYLEGDASETVRLGVESHAAVCDSCGALLADLMLIPGHAAALPALAPSRDLWQGIAERIDANVVLPLDSGRRVHVAPRRAWVRSAIAAAALVVLTAGVTHVLTRVSLAPATVAALPAATQQVAATQPVVAPEASAPTAEITSTASESPSGAATVAERRDGNGERSTRSAPPAGRASSPERATGNPNLRLASAQSQQPLLRDAEPVYESEIGKLRKIVRDRHSSLDPATIAVLEQSVAVIDSAIAQSRAALAKDPASGFLATQLNHSLEKKVELLRTAASLPART